MASKLVSWLKKKTDPWTVFVPDLLSTDTTSGTGAPIFRAEVAGLDVELIERVGVGNYVAGIAYASHVEAAVKVIGHLANHVVG